MTQQRKFLDIWLVESNTVYKEVPFTVVTDWIQQGRLLEDDMYKPSGTRDWFKFGGVPDFAPYFPRPEPNRTEDRAEALEPVHVEFTFQRPKEEEDDDIDMIPLIDVSLVLLVFFMLTASTAAMAAYVNKPEVEHTLMADDPDSLRIDVHNDAGEPVYSLAEGTKPPEEGDRDLRSLTGLMARLQARLEQMPGQVEVVINADKDLKAVHVRRVLVALRADAVQKKIRINYFGATQRNP